MPISAVRHVRRMRGGAQAHLMRCSDGHYYVVKFQNNPQHIRVLANELLATRLAQQLDLPVRPSEIVEVGAALIDRIPELHIQLAHSSVRCTPGVQFGSRYVVAPLQGRVFDYLPIDQLHRIGNLNTFAGMLVLDKWTGNTDGRQACFWQRGREKTYTAAFIDQGYCFNAGEWTFPDHPLRGIFGFNEVYTTIRDWRSFEPWLSKVERFDEGLIWQLAAEVPKAWYEGDWSSFSTLVTNLIARRKIVRSLIDEFRVSPRRPFPLWVERKPMANGCNSTSESVQALEQRLA